MPSKSPKQERLMRAAAHSPEFARKAGVPQDVAQEFSAADKRKKRKTLHGGQFNLPKGKC